MLKKQYGYCDKFVTLFSLLLQPTLQHAQDKGKEAPEENQKS